MPPRLLPTPQSSKYVEQFLAQPVDAFGKGAQNAQFAAQLANALAAGFAGYQDRKRKRAGQDALTEAIVRAEAPSGWVNPDAGMDAGYAQLPRSDVTQGRVPEGVRPVGAEVLAAAMAGPSSDLSMDRAHLPSIADELVPTDAEIQQGQVRQAMQRYEAARTPEMPEGGQVVPITPFRPEAAMLEDKTQVRGRESILNALLTDERLRDLGPEDISLAQKMTLDEMMQQEPGHYLDADQKKAFGYATTDVVWQARGGAPQLLKSMAPEEPEYVEYWDIATGDSLGLVAKGSAEEKQLVSAEGVTGGKPDKPLQIVRAMHARGVVENSDEWKDTLDNFIKSAAKGAGNTVIQMYETADNAFNVALAKGQADQLLDLEAAAGASQELLYQLELMSTIPTPNEGILSNFHHTVRKWSHDVGIPMSAEDVTKIRHVEQFKSTFTNLLAAKLKTQTGPQTETDAQRMGDSLAKLTNMHDANKFIINMSIALETRKIEQARFWSAYSTKHGNIRGVAAKWEAHKEKTPLFTYNYNTGVHMFYPQWKDDIRADNAAAQNLEWDGKTYANNDDGLEKLWQDQHLKYMTTARQ